MKINVEKPTPEKLEKLKGGALAKARRRSEELKKSGASAEVIKKDEEYMKCQKAFSDFS